MYVHESRIAGLIPARRGSERVKNKNISLLADKPMVQWTMEAAAESKLLYTYFSTDYLPRDLKFKLPNKIRWIDRPYNYSLSTSSANMYIQHFFELYPTKYDAVVLLQPTCPLRSGVDIDNAIEMYINSKKETLVSAYRIDNKAKLYDAEGRHLFGELSYTQQAEKGLEHLFVRNSAIYIFSREHFFRERSIFSHKSLIYEMHQQRSIDVNFQADLIYAQRFMKYKGGNLDYDI